MTFFTGLGLFGTLVPGMFSVLLPVSVVSEPEVFIGSLSSWRFAAGPGPRAPVRLLAVDQRSTFCGS